MCGDAKNYQSFLRVGAGVSTFGGRWRSGMTYANLRVVRESWNGAANTSLRYRSLLAQ
jgi:hypothetical protein